MSTSTLEQQPVAEESEQAQQTKEPDFENVKPIIEELVAIQQSGLPEKDKKERMQGPRNKMYEILRGSDPETLETLKKLISEELRKRQDNVYVGIMELNKYPLTTFPNYQDRINNLQTEMQGRSPQERKLKRIEFATHVIQEQLPPATKQAGFNFENRMQGIVNGMREGSDITEDAQMLARDIEEKKIDEVPEKQKRQIIAFLEHIAGASLSERN